MKYSIVLLIFVSVKISFAQSITNTNQFRSKSGKLKQTSIPIAMDTPIKTFNKPLYVLFTHGKMIVNADTLKGFENLPALQIKSLNVLSDSIKTKKYGQSMKSGVFEIYLDDEKYPNAFDSLKKGTFKPTYKLKKQDYQNYKGKLIH